jgi:hypothetical protein
MFQFPPFASPPYDRNDPALPGPGCPIRKSTDLGSFAPSRGFSQLITSFLASLYQGIHRVPFAFLTKNLITQHN